MFPLRMPTCVGLHLLPMEKRGLSFDTMGKAVMMALDPEFSVPPDDDAPHDLRRGNSYYDLKLITDKNGALGKNGKPKVNYAWLSHNEYLFARAHSPALDDDTPLVRDPKLDNMLYVMYQEMPEHSEAHLLCVADFEYIRKHGLVIPYTDGQPVFCKATGKQEHGWSINVDALRDQMASDVRKGVVLPKGWYNSNTLRAQ